MTIVPRLCFQTIMASLGFAHVVSSMMMRQTPVAGSRMFTAPATTRSVQKKGLFLRRNRLFLKRQPTGISTRRFWISGGSNNSPEEKNHHDDERPRNSDWLAKAASPPQDYGMTRASLLGRAAFIPSFLDVGGGLIAGIVAVSLGMLYWNQEKMLYIPELEGIPRHNAANPPGYRSPSEYDDLPFEEHRIETDDGVQIHSWLLLQPVARQQQRPTIVFYHGNAGNIGIRLPNAKQMYDFLQCNILLVEYRGYGDSDDAPITEKGLKLDCEAAIRFVRNHPSIDSSKIFVFGRSLGGAAGFHVAQWAEKNGIPLAGLIVENTFISVGRMVDALFPFLSPIKSIVLRMDWDCGKIAPTLKVPILYLAGDADEIVPYSHMRELYESSRGSPSACVRIHVIKNGTHNDTWVQGGRLYWERIQDFLKEATAFERG